MKKIKFFNYKLKAVLFLVFAPLFCFSSCQQEHLAIKSDTVAALTSIVISLESPLNDTIAIALFNDKGLLWEYFNGNDDTCNHEKLSKNSIVYLGELSAQVTMLALLTLVQNGKISLDSTIAYYMPDFFSNSTADTYLQKIGQLSIRTILTETTGWNVSAQGTEYNIYNDLQKLLASSPNKYQPGARYTKSNAMIDLLGLLIEKVSGKRFTEYMQAEVFSKLRMSSARFISNKIVLRQVSHNESTTQLFSSFSPAYSLSLTFLDCIKLYSAMLSNGDKNIILDQRLMQNMFIPSITDQLNKQGFETGAGWMLTEPDLRYLGKTAWNYGLFLDHKTVVMLLLDKKIGILISTRNNNRIIATELKNLASKLLRAYAETELNIKEPPFVPPVPVSLDGIIPPAYGVYASDHGALALEMKASNIFVSHRGGYAEFIHTGSGFFRPAVKNEYESLRCNDNKTIVIRWRTGAENKFTFQTPIKDTRYLWLKPGTYSLQNPQRKALKLTFNMREVFGNYLLTDDEGKDYLIKPLSQSKASIICDETSVFFGLMLYCSKDGTISLLMD